MLTSHRFFLILFFLVACAEQRAKTNFQRAVGVPDPIFMENQGSGFVGPVDVIALQPDGKILVGGRMSSFQGVACSSLLRLNVDGTLDESFKVETGFNDSVSALLVREDNKILVGGGFTQYQGAPAAYLIQLNSDASPDSSFNSELGTGFDAGVNALARASGGELFVAGAFSILNGNSRKGIVKLSSAGADDAAFAAAIGTGFDLPVADLVLRDESGPESICAGGSFTDFNGLNAHRVACLSLDGSMVTAFSTGLGTGFNHSVFTLLTGGAVSNGLLVGGVFDSLQGAGRLFFAHLSKEGTLEEDSAFNTDLILDQNVSAMAWDAENNLLVGGAFTSYGAGSVGRILRLDGTQVDLEFAEVSGSGFDAPVSVIEVQPDGKILVGGEFTRYDGSANVGRLIRLQ
jgi:uncharacterized delta-60 repeat protein